jgi:hypothetical protein
MPIAPRLGAHCTPDGQKGARVRVQEPSALGCPTWPQAGPARPVAHWHRDGAPGPAAAEGGPTPSRARTRTRNPSSPGCPHRAGSWRSLSSDSAERALQIAMVVRCPPAAAAAGDSEFKKFRGLGVCQLESAGATMRPAGRARLGRVFLSVSVFAASPILALGMEPGVQVLLHPSSPHNERAFCSGNKLTAERGHADCSLHGVLPALNRRILVGSNLHQAAMCSEKHGVKELACR